MTTFTVPGLTDKQGAEVAELLQKQLSTYNDLHLTLKHVHWNVVGPNFTGVHEMIDPQGRTGPRLRRRGRRTDRRAGSVATGHPGRDHQGPHLGRLLRRS